MKNILISWYVETGEMYKILHFSHTAKSSIRSKRMSDLKGIEYKRFEDIKHIREDGNEYWSARELGLALDYVKWENFIKVIKRAMIACENRRSRSNYETPKRL